VKGEREKRGEIISEEKEGKPGGYELGKFEGREGREKSCSFPLGGKGKGEKKGEFGFGKKYTARVKKRGLI